MAEVRLMVAVRIAAVEEEGVEGVDPCQWV